MKKTLFITLSVFSAILLLTTVQSCYNDSEEELYGTVTSSNCDTTNATFAAFISPLLKSECAKSACHDATSAQSGANLSTYAATKSYISSNKDRFIGSIKHTSGFSQMPRGASKLALCDIAKIDAWLSAGYPNN